LKELRAEEKKRIVSKLTQLEDFPAIRLDIINIAGKENTSNYA
jgi:hypothetical protein